MRRDEFEQLYRDHAEPLFSFLAYRTGDRALAEEIAAEAFARAYGARSRFDRRRASGSTWLYGIALNLARDHARRAVTHDRAMDRVAASGTGAAPEEPADARLSVMAAIAQLSAEEREAVALRYGADLTAPQIAAVLDEPLTTVEGRIYRGLRKLRPLLDAG